jgi:predicted DCC family thiol-disulfide oxidoreductase YuxK
VSALPQIHASVQARSTYVDVVPVPAARPDIAAAHGDKPGYGDNIMVIADDGRFWAGPPDAYLVVMWAVRGLRAASYLLSLPILKALTNRVFQWVAGNKYAFNQHSEDVCASRFAVTV